MLNVGAAVGPILGGLAGMADARFAFAISAALFMGLGICSIRMPRDSSTSSEAICLGELGSGSYSSRLMAADPSRDAMVFPVPTTVRSISCVCGKNSGTVWCVSGVCRQRFGGTGFSLDHEELARDHKPYIARDVGLPGRRRGFCQRLHGSYDGMVFIVHCGLHGDRDNPAPHI